MVTKEEFIERAGEIHATPIRTEDRADLITIKVNLENCIRNQKRLAFMLEYIAQRLEG